MRFQALEQLYRGGSKSEVVRLSDRNIRIIERSFATLFLVMNIGRGIHVRRYIKLVPIIR